MSSPVTDDTFEAEVIKSPKLTLVDFWAEWCAPCKMLGPILDELSKEYDGKVNIYKMNIDENPKIPSSFGIRSIPTLMLFKDGALIDTKVGVSPKPTLITWLDSHI